MKNKFVDKNPLFWYNEKRTDDFSTFEEGGEISVNPSRDSSAQS